MSRHHYLVHFVTIPFSAAAGVLIAALVYETEWSQRATLLAGGLAAFATFCAIGVAVRAIAEQKQTARIQTTIAHLAANGRDKDILAAKQKFLALASEPGGLAKWAAERYESSDESQAIRLYLNSFELISLGIQNEIIDYELFKSWNRSTILSVWSSGAPYVAELRKRTGRPALFHELQELAQDFDHDKRPVRKFGPKRSLR